jgi:hypothetical protein
MKLIDAGRVKGHLLVEKYDAQGRHTGNAEVTNLFLTVGINELWKLFSGQSANTFNNANAQIGIGDSSTAASAGQTDLQAATNKTYKAQDASFPSVPASGQIQYKSTFGSSDANYVWNEFVLKHSGSAICLDRGVSSMGTKASGTTWVVTLTLTIT